MIVLIAAVGENGAIGKDNRMLWHLPDDFKRFKRVTMGYPLVMGRKTFESLGGKPLPGRPHIVITRNTRYQPSGVITVHSLEEALEKALSMHDKVYIIGGGTIYAQAMEVADELDITRVHASPDADTFFPAIDPEIWEETGIQYHPADAKHRYAFSFVRYVRK